MCLLSCSSRVVFLPPLCLCDPASCCGTGSSSWCHSTGHVRCWSEAPRYDEFDLWLLSGLCNDVVNFLEALPLERSPVPFDDFVPYIAKIQTQIHIGGIYRTDIMYSVDISSPSYTETTSSYRVVVGPPGPLYFPSSPSLSTHPLNHSPRAYRRLLLNPGCYCYFRNRLPETYAGSCDRSSTDRHCLPATTGDSARVRKKISFAIHSFVPSPDRYQPVGVAWLLWKKGNHSSRTNLFILFSLIQIWQFNRSLILCMDIFFFSFIHSSECTGWFLVGDWVQFTTLLFTPVSKGLLLYRNWFNYTDLWYLMKFYKNPEKCVENVFYAVRLNLPRNFEIFEISKNFSNPNVLLFSIYRQSSRPLKMFNFCNFRNCSKISDCKTRLDKPKVILDSKVIKCRYFHMCVIFVC